MSTPILKAGKCCPPDCCEPEVTNIPGEAGENGTNGTDGADGLNAFTLTTAQFTMPDEQEATTVNVVSSDFLVQFQIVFVEFAGYMQVLAKPSSTSVTLKNLEDTASNAYLDNASPSTNIPSGAQVSPTGPQGAQGASGSGTLNDLAPTNTKGDLMVDSGANNPDADVNRFAVGANGTRLMADSGQPLGVIWAKVDLSDATQVENELPITNGGTGESTATDGFNALSPLTTEGDLITHDGTDNVRLPIGADGEVLQSDGADAGWAKIGVDNLDAPLTRTPTDVVLVQEQQTAGTAGGSFSSGAWRTRALNTEVVDTGTYASVGSSKITLAAGTYRARAWAVANQCGSHQIRLQNVTDGTPIAYGMSAFSSTTDNALTASQLSCRFTIADTKDIELQHQCQTTKATDGFGVAVNFASLEIYSEVYLEREAL